MIELEKIKYNNEVINVDLNDILDILDTSKKKYYSIIFQDGDAWFNVKLSKKIIDKFNKIKEKRGQK